MNETDDQPDLHTAWQRMHAERRAEQAECRLEEAVEAEPEAAAVAVAKVDEALVALERAVTNLRSALQR